MKKLMILGAGVYQVPLIKTAKRLGLYSIVVSKAGDYPGFQLADKVYYEDTTNYTKILEIARKEAIDGIVTAGTDVAVITLGKICTELGLKGLSFEAAQIVSDKRKMKERFQEGEVRTAKFRYIPLKEKDIEKVLDGLQFPLIFKAVDSSGSRGIVKVDSPATFEQARKIVMEVTKKDYFIIEEFLEGNEFGAQAFVYNGEIQFIMPHGDYVFHGNTGVPIGHWAPFYLSDEIIVDAKKQLVKAIKAIGLDNCAINADFILYKEKAYVLELGGRSGATCLAEMVSLYYGFDYYEKIIRASLGEELSFKKNFGTANAAMLLYSNKTGTIKNIINKNVDHKQLVELQFDYKVGQKVRKFSVGSDRIGHVIVTGETLEEARKVLENMVDQIQFVVE